MRGSERSNMIKKWHGNTPIGVLGKADATKGRSPFSWQRRLGWVKGSVCGSGHSGSLALWRLYKISEGSHQARHMAIICLNLFLRQERYCSGRMKVNVVNIHGIITFAEKVMGRSLLDLWRPLTGKLVFGLTSPPTFLLRHWPGNIPEASLRHCSPCVPAVVRRKRHSTSPFSAGHASS